MAFGDTGPATNVLAALAVSIGFGLVVGGFVGGSLGFVSTRSQRAAEKWALIGSYFGALVALGLLAADTL